MKTCLTEIVDNSFPNCVEQFLDCVYKNMGKASIQIAEETRKLLEPYPKPLLDLAYRLNQYGVYRRCMSDKIGASIMQYFIEIGYSQKDIESIISVLQNYPNAPVLVPADKCS